MDLLEIYEAQSLDSVQGSIDYMEYTENDSYNDEYDASNPGENWDND